MLEPIVAFVAILVLFAFFIGVGHIAEEAMPVVAVPLGLVAMYFLVRLIHWAWETPIPLP